MYILEHIQSQIKQFITNTMSAFTTDTTTQLHADCCENNNNINDQNSFISTMREKYGIKSELIIPSINHKFYPQHIVQIENKFSVGDFWYFRIADTDLYRTGIDEIVEAECDNKENQTEYCAYLEAKYGDEWLFVTIGTDDDCALLVDMREKDRYERDLAEQMDQIVLEQDEKMDEEEAEMNRLLHAGEITRRQFNNWLIDQYYKDMNDI